MSVIDDAECPSVNLQCLMKPWQNFLLHDNELFVKNCVSTHTDTLQ